MDITPIETKRDYRRALREIEGLMDAKRGSPEGDRLDVLVTLVEAWEAKHYPIDLPDPVVLPVRADEPDIDNAIGIVDPHRDPVLVARDVEHRPAVLEDAGRADVAFDIGGRRPVRRAHLAVPGHYGFAGVDVCGVLGGLRAGARSGRRQDCKRT